MSDYDASCADCLGVSAMTSEDIKKRLIDDRALFNYMYVIEQRFDILPDDHNHFGAAISYQDIFELREDFLSTLLDTVVDWVYSSEKYNDLKKQVMSTGRSDAAAAAAVIGKAHRKFRKGKNTLLIQGQLGELLLFHFIQHIMHAVPLLRKMPITTSAEHERFGADAIHYKIENGQNIIILGEAKAYTSKYKFKDAFEDAITSILKTYENFRDELDLYLHEDFLDKELDEVAEKFLNNTLPKTRVELVCLILYNETRNVPLTDEKSIKTQIEKIIQERYKSFDNSKIELDKYPILNRITYIVFPVWKFEELAKEFQTYV